MLIEEKLPTRKKIKASQRVKAIKSRAILVFTALVFLPSIRESKLNNALPNLETKLKNTFR
jgi:hypothetical protein